MNQAHKGNGDNFDGVPVITPDVVQGMGGGTTAGELIAQGRTIEQIRSQYHTAVRVQVPRDIERARALLRKSAEYAGDSFFYAWQAETRGGGKALIEGKSHDLAMAAAQSWGNATVEVFITTQTVAGAELQGVFVDFETGFTLMRPFVVDFGALVLSERQKSKPSELYRQRMAFMQAAISRCARNVALAALPEWFTDEAFRIAKESAGKRLAGENLVKAIDESVLHFKQAYGVVQEQLEIHLHKKRDEWSSLDVVTLRSIVRGVREGTVNIPETFPPLDKSESAKPQPAAPATAQAPHQPVVKPPADPGIPAADPVAAGLTDAQGELLDEINEILLALAGNDAAKRKALMLSWTNRATDMITKLRSRPELLDMTLDRARVQRDEAAAARAEAQKKGKLL